MRLDSYQEHRSGRPGNEARLIPLLIPYSGLLIPYSGYISRLKFFLSCKFSRKYFCENVSFPYINACERV